MKNECDDEYNESSFTIVKVLDSEDDFENLTDKKENKIQNEFEKKKSCPTNGKDFIFNKIILSKCIFLTVHY